MSIEYGDVETWYIKGNWKTTENQFEFESKHTKDEHT